MIVVLILSLLLLVLLSAFVSLSEVSLFSLSPSKVRSFRHTADARKLKVAQLLGSPKDLLVTIIIFNVMTHILIQNVTSNLFATFPGWTLSVGVPLAITLVFGEVLPKSIGLSNNARVSYRIAPFLGFLQKMMTPLRVILTSVTSYISRAMFFFLKKDKNISTDELQHALKASSSQGVVQEDEAELLRGYLHLQESQVKDLMRPREEVLFFDIEKPLAELIHFFVDKECSRIPVCQGSLDEVIGLAVGQELFMQRAQVVKPEDLLPLLRPPFFVPESTAAIHLLQQMYAQKESIAIVVDEYGMVSGLISQEDLVEAVVGEIIDARDLTCRYTRSNEDEIIASGKLELAEFEEIFGVALETKNHMVTLGGWLSEQMGDIPKIGAKYMKDNFLFHVLSADPTRVRRIYVRRLK